MSSTLESLYALFSPLWARDSMVNGSNLVNILLRHFTKRCETELLQGKVRYVLSRGQNLIHDALREHSPLSFAPDAMASADGFMQLLLDPRHPNDGSTLSSLFAVAYSRTLVCSEYDYHRRETSSNRTVISVTAAMFKDAALSYDQVDILIHVWVTDGLFSQTGILCRDCHPKDQPVPRDKGTSKMDSYSKINVTNFPDTAPLHLYFHLQGVVDMQPRERSSFMGESNWPARLDVGQVTYQLITRGFWAGNHYWCQVVRPIEGIMGVWHYDEMKNGGYSQLINRDINSLGGCHPNTSWVCYSRLPFDHERLKLETALRDLMLKFPDNHQNIPFSMPNETTPFGGGLPSLEDPTALDQSSTPHETGQRPNRFKINIKVQRQEVESASPDHQNTSHDLEDLDWEMLNDDVDSDEPKASE